MPDLKPTMKIVKFGLLMLTLTSNPTSVVVTSLRAADEADIVKLAPYEVSDTSLQLGFHLRIASSKKTGRVTEVRFSVVESGSLADKAGLRVGDRMVAVDGHDVVGITRSELNKLCTANVKWGEFRTFVFTIERGFLRRQSTISLTIRMKPKQE